MKKLVVNKNNIYIMDDNSLLMIVLAFILGCMCSGMMKQMCGQRLVEGSNSCWKPCKTDWTGWCPTLCQK